MKIYPNKKQLNLNSPSYLLFSLFSRRTSTMERELIQLVQFSKLCSEKWIREKTSNNFVLLPVSSPPLPPSPSLFLCLSLSLSLSLFAGPFHLPDIWGVQHRGKSALCLKAVGVNERNDKFLMGSLLKSCVGGCVSVGVCVCVREKARKRERELGDGRRRRRGDGEREERRGHRFQESIPLPFMLGLTYMHPSPTIKH